MSIRVIPQRSRHIERRVVAWLGCYESMSRLGSIAAVLRLRSTSRVSALIAECDRDLAHDPMLRIAIDRCLELLRRDLDPSAGALSGARSGEHAPRLIVSAPQTRSGSNFAGLRCADPPPHVAQHCCEFGPSASLTGKRGSPQFNRVTLHIDRRIA